MDSGDDRPSATFNMVVTNFTSSVRNDDGVHSNICMIRNIPWKLAVKKEELSKGKHLGIYLSCLADDEEESNCICQPDWTCSAKVKLSVIHHSGEHLVREYDHVFHSDYDECGYDDFITWNAVTNPQNGYITKNTVCIRAEVVASIPVGIDFEDNNQSDELLESERKIQALQSEVKWLKSDLVLERSNVSQLQNDLAKAKSDLSQLKSDVAIENAAIRSKMETLETTVANLTSQTSETKNVRRLRSASRNANTNSSRN